MNLSKHIIYIFLLVTTPVYIQAQLPCITDNTGTLGKYNGQIEISNGLGFHNEHRCIENSTEIAPVFTFGLLDNMDLVIGYPFLFSNIQDDSGITRVAGFSDISIEVKYCFYNNNNFSVAIKPGLSFPMGKYEQGLGSGKISSSAFLISSINLSPVEINCNIGYIQNANKCGDALNIWHFSLAADYSTKQNLHIILNSGIEKNPDSTDKTYPIFGLIGIYYCINDNCEISTGYKHGITSAETQHSFIYGITLRF
ncbi:MAG TPA: transporter [Bacteroidales bacterium]|nr:transporter [Bacteroidales bacterium]HPS17674.1 transporter [Bacteroidales bacterium]